MVSGADTASARVVPPEAFGTSLLSNLAPLMDADPGFERDDFYPGALERYTLKGGTWVLPRSLPVALLSYNKELFKRAGLAAPQPGWSWDDLRTAAQQLAGTNSAAIETFGIYGEDFRLLLDDLDSQQPDLFSTPFDRVQLDTPAVVAAFERMRALRRSGAVFTADARPGETTLLDPAQVMREGRLGIWGQSLMAAAAYPEPVAPDGRIGTLPYPPMGAALSMMNPHDASLIDGYVISGGTSHPNEAWRWIEYISRQQIDPSFADTIMPARKSLAEASGFWKAMDAEQAAAYQWSVEHAPPASGSAGREDAGLIVDVLLQAYIALDQNPEADPAGVLSDTQRELWGRVAQSRLTPTVTPDLGTDNTGVGSFPFEPDVAPQPVGAGGLRANDLGVRGFHISAGSAHAQECWTWITFLSGELGGVGAGIPARRSLALSEDYARIATPGLLDLYRAYADALGRPGQRDSMAEVYQRFDLYWFFKAISAASEQDKELSAELAEAQRLTTAYLDCMVKERQQKAATCARNTDPDYGGFITQDGGR